MIIVYDVRVIILKILNRFFLTDIKLLILLIASTSFLVTLILVPIAKGFGEKFNINDIPTTRKLHTKSIVRLGGVPIFIGFLCGLLSIFFTGNLDKFSLENVSAYGRVLLFTGSAIFFLGLFDDLFKLSPKFRLGFQFIVASIAWFNNLRINSLGLGFISPNLDDLNIPIVISFIITVIWISGIINAINWMDGADGLATGLLIIASVSFFIIEYANNMQYLTCILASLIGAAMAFLIFNYNPAKIIMGDSGSYFLGFNLSIVSFISSTDNNSPFNVPVVILIMFIPIADMIYVIFNRIIKGKVPLYPDKTHLHHRLLDTGLNQRQTVKIIWSLSALFSVIALVIDGKINSIFIFYALIIHCLCNVRIREFFKNLLC